MQIAKYLETYQPIIYKTFVNSLKTNHLSHAYLLSGTPGTPLLETAKCLAKTIVCDDPDPLACNNCITCLRIDDNNYPDFVILNGETGNVKKDEVDSLESQFEKTAFEEKGIMIYILHLVENMSAQVVNGILKFLEEPGNNVFAFLTTNNENNILPTIISRCQVLRLKLMDRQEVIKQAIEDGVLQKDAELLSYFYNDSDLILSLMTDEDKEDERELYESAKESLEIFLEALNDDSSTAIYEMETNIIPKIKDKGSARYFIDMVTQSFQEIFNIQNGKITYLSTLCDTLKELAGKLPNIDKMLVDVLKSRNLLNLNVNIPLLLDHIIINLTKQEA